MKFTMKIVRMHLTVDNSHLTVRGCMRIPYKRCMVGGESRVVSV